MLFHCIVWRCTPITRALSLPEFSTIFLNFFFCLSQLHIHEYYVLPVVKQDECYGDEVH